MTEQIVPPVPHAENHGNAGETGDVVETVGIEPTGETPRESHAVEPNIAGITGTMVVHTNRGRAAETAGPMAQEATAPMQHDPIPVPLRNRHGVPIAFAVLDAEDAHLADDRWYLDSDPSRKQDKQYARRNVNLPNGKRGAVYLHREVLGLERGDKRQVDHINGLTLDCRRENLRIASNAENAQNRRKRTGTSSRFRGVTWDRSRGKWMAHATLNGRRRTIGRFDSEEEAGAAAAEFRREHMPFSQEAA